MKSIILISLLLTAFAARAAQDESNQSVFSRNQKVDSEGVELYDSNLDLKNYKKFGFGVSAGGLTGTVGINLEANMNPEEALAFGLGTGKSYNTFQIAWKHNFEAAYLSPYTKVGYANWFNSNGSSSDAGDNSILKRVLSDDQIRENKFSANFIAGGMGLEYNQLEGDLAGVNFYGELLMLGEIHSSVYLPTAGIGMTYFY